MRKFFREEEGVTLVEYGLLVGLISVVAIAAIQNVGSSVNQLFSTVASRLSSAARAGGAGR